MKKTISIAIALALGLSLLIAPIASADGPWSGELWVGVASTSTVTLSLTTAADLQIYWDESPGAEGDDYITVLVEGIAVTDSVNYDNTVTVSLPAGTWEVGFRCDVSGAGDVAPIYYLMTAYPYTGDYFIPELDTDPPVVTISLSPNVLFPANRQLIDVVATVDVDDYDPSPTVSLVSVTSSDPDNGIGDGNTANDIVIVDDFTFRLRAEFTGKTAQRVYTVTYQATDWNGNTTTASAQVLVPRKPR